MAYRLPVLFCAVFLVSLFIFSVSLSWSASANNRDGKSGIDSYVRVAVLYEKSRNSNFFDDACQPAAGLVPYFGCVSGNDGRMIGAYGDFGKGLAGELSLGLRLNPLWRVEFMFARQNSFAFSGNANFLNAGSKEPVSGSLNQTRFGLRGYLDIMPLLNREPGFFQPFIGAGLGLVRNSIKTMRYDFPHLNQPRYTTVPAGSVNQFFWTVLAGSAFKLNEKNYLDISAHYADYGRVRTAAGNIVVVRPTGKLYIPVHPTSARLQAYGLSLGLRHHF